MKKFSSVKTMSSYIVKEIIKYRNRGCCEFNIDKICFYCSAVGTLEEKVRFVDIIMDSRIGDSISYYDASGILRGKDAQVNIGFFNEQSNTCESVIVSAHYFIEGGVIKVGNDGESAYIWRLSDVLSSELKFFIPEFRKKGQPESVRMVCPTTKQMVSFPLYSKTMEKIFEREKAIHYNISVGCYEDEEHKLPEDRTPFNDVYINLVLNEDILHKEIHNWS